jgi:sugar lactone lactonase YvrE
MVVDGNTLYVGEPNGGVVRQIDLGTHAVSTLVGVTPWTPYQTATGPSAVLNQPAGLAVAQKGTLIVADVTSLDNVALPGASVTVGAGKIGYYGGSDGVGAAATVSPAGVVSDGAGTIYFTGKNTVRRYDLKSGKVDTLAGVEGQNGATDGVGTAARFYWPQGIAVDLARGVLYVSDTQNHTIRKLVIASGDVTTLVGTAGSNGAVDDVGAAARLYFPKGLAYDGQGGLYVADSENGAIRRVDVATAAVTTYVGVLGQKGLQPGALPAHLNAPQGVALLPDGGLVVTDEQALLVVH